MSQGLVLESVLFLLAAFGISGREENQELGGAAGRNTNEETGDQVETF